MTRIEWDQVGERRFQTGVDRGVLYLPTVAVPWNGLTGVDENVGTKLQPYYQDGIKYMEQETLGDFSATLKAFTYPQEFEACIGHESVGNGVYVHDQPSQLFGLSYRTLIGDDISGLEAGYTIHVMYNLRAIPSSLSYSSLSGTIAPMEFSWALTSQPEIIPWMSPSAHVSIKSIEIDPGTLYDLEAALYGYEGSDAYLPNITDFVAV